MNEINIKYKKVKLYILNITSLLSFLKLLNYNIQKVFSRKIGEQISLQVTVLKGLTKNHRIPIVCAYVGDNQKKMEHWKNLLFSVVNDYIVESLYANDVKRYLRKQYPNLSLILFEQCDQVKKYYSKTNSFSIPGFVETVIDIDDSMKNLCHKSKSGYANTQRLISTYKLSFNWSESDADKKDFYFNMYLPYIKERHKDESLIVSYEDIFGGKFPRKLMMIKKANHKVAGGVANFVPFHVSLAFFGVRDGHFDTVKQGVLGAIYYFLIEEIRKDGIDRLFCGGSPPILSNGITRHKIGLLARIDKENPYKHADLVSCVLLKDTKGIRDFLTSSPYVYVGKNGDLTGAVWVQPNKYSCITDFEKEINLVFRFGLDRCNIFEWGSNLVPEAWCQKLQYKKITVCKAEKQIASF